VRDIAELSWGAVAAAYGVCVAILLIDGAIGDGPLLSDTALISLPIAALLCFGAFGLIKRRYRG